jgi:foldase protein PrsA
MRTFLRRTEVLETLKENWFVVLVALIMVVFVGYFIYDQNKDNVTVKQSSDGQDVIATLKDTNITAEELYDLGEPFDSSILYYMYRNAVIDQSVETTDDLETTASNMESLILYNAKSQSDDYEELLTSELASYGYSSYEDLYQYCLVSAKENVLDEQYVDAHFDELKDTVEENSPRTISIITMAVADVDNLTDDEQTKKDNIDKALESGTFAEAATAFSEDTDTAAYKGFYGYVDSSSSDLDSDLLSAVLALEKGETTDWITVTDSSTGTTYLYKAYVDETDIQTIYDSEDEDVHSALISAFISDNSTLQIDAIVEAAEKLDITFESDSAKEKVESYISTLKGE